VPIEGGGKARGWWRPFKALKAAVGVEGERGERAQRTRTAGGASARWGEEAAGGRKRS
jgi:hypothetical protein